ncbi:MAG TPA: hypothetical protein VHM70_32965 [Polyangiaceae bacterium]|nr:hypothetical protein [Polyangiaceae bacterium]
MTHLISISFVSLLLAACASGSAPAPATPSDQSAPKDEQAKAAAEPSASESATSAPAATPSAVPAAAAILTHQVADYKAWRVVFDEHAGARQKAGILGSHVNQAADNPNLVSVYLAAPSAAVIQNFLADPELKSTMQRAGVVSAPVVTMLTPVEDSTIKDRPLAGAIVRHTVADFDQWKKAFDEHAPARTQAGIIGYAVNRMSAEPNTVVIYLQAENLDSLRTFAASDDLKKAMSKAGVQGPPVISFVQGSSFGQ